MKLYLQTAPYIVGFVWLYIIYARFASARHLARTFHVPLRYILTLGPSKFDAHDRNNGDYLEAVSAHKRLMKHTFWLWILTLFLFIAGAFIVGVVTNLK